ncbi:class I SAM-dependent DNA methyltransferase [Hydrogenimonas sp.]
MGLELYGKIEPLLGFEEEALSLYDRYIGILKSWEPRSLVDIGCGSGGFLLRAQRAVPSLTRAVGVDLSETMVARAKGRGVTAIAADICDVKERFDAATAVFDVLNYLDREALRRFMGCVEALLEPGGIFVADINTLYGFEEVAQGALVREEGTSMVVLESLFEKGSLRTRIDLFEEEGSGCYRREHDSVVQYHHTPEAVADASGLELIQIHPVTLYGEEPDKEILLLKKGD